MPIRILFVDDDANVLSGLRRMLHSMRGEWEMAFAESGAQALQILENQPYDVIVSDMRMPQMDGAQLLSEVRRRHPETVRIILSGHSDQEMILKSIGPTHQYLTKPCEPGVLRSTIERALTLSHLLTDARIKAVVGQIEALPSMPALLTELTEELQRPSCSLQTVGDIITRDVGMTTRILHLVNSAFFGLRREISNPAAAVTYLGLNTVVSLITTFHIFRQVDESYKTLLELDRLWEHSMNTGVVAKAIAKAETGDKKLTEDAFAAGLMHDAGRLVLGSNFPQRYRKVMDLAATTKRPLLEMELKEFGASHAEVGAYLVGLWGLSNSITEALAYHHHPQDCVARAFCPLTAVHAACALDHLLSGNPAARTGTILNDVYLRELGLEARVDAWRDLATEALQMGEVRP